ncbi:MAG: hypothetical protein JW927_03785 [Deltaproteobacteria bacterium]|nr:hypothetical protein [Deltaproteobacteria bacterium]
MAGQVQPYTWFYYWWIIHLPGETRHALSLQKLRSGINPNVVEEKYVSICVGAGLLLGSTKPWRRRLPALLLRFASPKTGWTLRSTPTQAFYTIPVGARRSVPAGTVRCAPSTKYSSLKYNQNAMLFFSHK